MSDEERAKLSAKLAERLAVLFHGNAGVRASLLFTFGLKSTEEPWAALAGSIVDNQLVLTDFLR